MKNILEKINIDENLNHSVQEAAKLFFNGGVFIYPIDNIYKLNLTKKMLLKFQN